MSAFLGAASHRNEVTGVRAVRPSPVRFLNLLQPFLPILPEVSSPDRKARLFVFIHARSSNPSSTGSFQPKSTMDGRHAPHFPGSLTSPPIWHHVLRLV
jgi:hypothetical protein